MGSWRREGVIRVNCSRKLLGGLVKHSAGVKVVHVHIRAVPYNLFPHSLPFIDTRPYDPVTPAPPTCP